MATDGISLYATLSELQILKDARIDKIQQPNKDILLFHLHGSACGRTKLLINIHNENGRIQLTNASFENPTVAPAFCMLLRKYLTGARIISLHQQGFDRIACISIIGKNDLEDELPLTLMIELMGRHGNLFLLDSNGTILDCMRHFGPGEDSLRICLPNCKYLDPPHQDRIHPFDLSVEQLDAFAQGRHPREWLADKALGISKLCAQQIVSNDTVPESIGAACYQALQNLKNRIFTPSVITGRGVLAFRPQNTDSRVFSSMSEAQEFYYKQRDEQTLLQAKKTAIHSAIEHAYKKTCKKLELFVIQSQNQDQMERDLRCGELLTANLGTAKVIHNTALVWDYYQNPPKEVSIPLDPQFSLSENAQRFFKRYRKEKAASSYAQSQIQSLVEERDYLDSLFLSLDTASTLDDLKELKAELVEQHYMHPDVKYKQKHPISVSEPYLYIAPDGTNIRVGRNNLQNDRLLKTELPDYYWMHAKNMPASHVYIESSAPSRETLFLAAQIAAYHSKAAHSSQVAIDYTLRKHVKKPSGARPGFVNYFNQHTVYVTPDSEKLTQYRIQTGGNHEVAASNKQHA